MKQKILIQLILTLVILTLSISGENYIYKVKKLNGEALVRHGAKEKWVKLSYGDTLRPEDTFFLDKNGYIEIEGNKILFKSDGGIIINISDLRRLTKEELLLQLAFEEMKSVPDVKKDKSNAKSTGIYGTEIEEEKTNLKTGWNLTNYWVKGVSALFENGFYETSAIRARNLMLKFDELKDNIELKMIIATSLEKLELYGEAISELNKILLSSKDKNLNARVEQKIQELKMKLASLRGDK
ncbi:hypothetical protein [Candidatus Kryptobacter tengchongensis]|uniref:Uncharacterized protein n=1 Tax=Kryptobacter tengchongensis TaxID=1643429 RepID=A0A916LI46_KRYT1|nr:hypothetical protein [Candidatus Kryptobacter tengchongensis]CUS97136.1 hypothetical protein JGI25_00215 [Candidatus Kryptobacter tengchongensis]